ncbi:serine hydrolase domain-containing protein [Lactococcus formosensis]|uniref:serine hydrolase domain-containing protein n=1 Tax=Lactococcus formosensis TaxID=1281486 RepID=UPI0013FDB257|nr:serine hydrolase domain-containing protein [Lactococcus formosensis]NHI67516.1 class A beta-lactamase-related serine hydrolase [Lactococcus garvieae]
MKNEKEFLETIDDYIAQEIFPGCHVAIVEEAEVQEFVRGNQAILPKVKPLVAGKKWDLASVSKVVGTGTVVINLVLSGKLELDAPFTYYYPEFHDESITLRQLLTHTTGINPFIENRDELDFKGLKDAIDHIEVTENKSCHYTDINFILLGFMLEKLYEKSLDEVFKAEVFEKWSMSETSFGPVTNAVPTSLDTRVGSVHDPKAKVLGTHCGSAGLFAPMIDLVKFVQGYFSDTKYLALQKNYAAGDRPRSLAWDFIHDQWLLHTGYTGTFILMNLESKKAVIFLSNRVHLKDERAQWIVDRDRLIEILIKNLN